MATDQALHGLDNLELSPLGSQESAGSRFARKAWGATWPKALAVVAGADRVAAVLPEQLSRHQG